MFLNWLINFLTSSACLGTCPYILPQIKNSIWFCPLLSGSTRLIEEHLLSAFDSTKQNPPAMVYRRICHMLGHLYTTKYQEAAQRDIKPDAVDVDVLNEEEAVEDLMRAAFYYSEAQSVTFRHNALLNISRKLRYVYR